MTVVLPEINFLATNPQELTAEIINSFEELEGRKLTQADPLHLIFLALASVITKQNILINDAAKQNLLYYARDKVLDHKGEEWGTPRIKATPSKATLRLHLSEPLTTSKIISKETLTTSDEGIIFFATKEEVVIQPGENYIDVEIVCTTIGAAGNGFVVGDINTLVNPLPYISKVENITASDGGAEAESDESLRSRVYLAPERLTNAGSEGAYEYFAKSSSALISDVYVYMPEPGSVNISVLMEGGGLPTEEIINAVHEKCNAKTVRPLTDLVTVEAPEVIHYDLDISYFIETNAVDKSLIHDAVTRAINDYIVWQSSKIGRDINPSKLISDCIGAGAKRIEVNSPNFEIVEPGQVAQLNDKVVTFGGVEDD